MYKKITTTTEEYSDVPLNGTVGAVNYAGNSFPMYFNSKDKSKKYAPCIRVDVPLMIKLLEFAREEASSDVDLHVLTGQMLEMSEEGRVLTIDDYEDLIDGIKKSTPTLMPQ